MLNAPVILANGTTAEYRGAINTSAFGQGTLTIGGSLSIGGGVSGSSVIKMDINDLITTGSNSVMTSGTGGVISVNGGGQEHTGDIYTIMTYANTVAPTLALSQNFAGFNPISLSVDETKAVVTVGIVPVAPNDAWFANSLYNDNTPGDGMWNTVVNAALSNWRTDAYSGIGVSQLPGSITNVHLGTSNPYVTSLNMTMGQNFYINSLEVTASISDAVISGFSTLNIGAGGLTDGANGPVTISANVNMMASQTWAINAFQPMVVTGILSSTNDVNFVKSGSGQLSLRGANTFGGNFTQAGGTVTLGSPTALGNGTVSYLIDASQGGLLQLGGSNVRIGTLNSENVTGAIVENGLGGTLAVLTIGGDGNSSFAGLLQDGAGTLGITKAGAGTLTLNHNNTYTGPTNVRQGQVTIPSGGTITSAANAQITVGNAANVNGVLEITNGVVLANKTTAPSVMIGNSDSSSGFIRVTNGTLTAAADIWLGNGVGGNGYSAFSMYGDSSVQAGSFFCVGNNNNRGVFNIYGGTLTDTGANFYTISQGGGLGNNNYGVMNLFGGNVTSSSTNAISMWVGESGQLGVLNVFNNGNLGLPGTLGITRVSGAVGQANLLGGNVTASAVISSGGSSVINFNGGTLASNYTTATFMGGLTNAYIWGNGANFYNDNSSMNITQSLSAPTGQGINTIPFTGGTGYLDTPMVMISGGGGTGATAVAGVDGSGNLTSITITNPGVGYTAAPTISLAGGGANAGGAAIGTAGLATNAGGGINKFGTGTLILAGVNTFTGPTTIYGGIVRITADNNLGAASAGVNFAGGSLQIAGANIILANGRNLDVAGMGGTLDMISSANKLVVPGGISGTGPLNVIGGGKLVVNGTGNTAINIFGSSGPTGNTSLGGIGTISGPVTLYNAGEINLADGSIGTLTLSGGLTVNSGIMRFDLGSVSSSTITDRLSLGGSTLTMNQGPTVTLTNLGLNPGTYTLVSFGGWAGGTPSLDSASAVYGSSQAALALTDNALQLIVTGVNIPSAAFWNGTLGTTWGTVNGSLTNFSNSIGGVNNTFQLPGAITDVYFATSGAEANGAISASLGVDVAARSVVVLASMTSSVTISGSNVMHVGGGGLVMQPGAGALTVSSNIDLLSDQTWTDGNSAATMTVSGAISGSHNLNFAGVGNIIVSGANTFVGNVNIVSGSVTLGSATALGAATNLLNISNGGVLNPNNSSVTVGGLNGGPSAMITGSGTVVVTPTINSLFAGSLTGAVALSVNAGAGSLTLTGNNNYTGVTTVAGGGKLLAGSATAFSAGSALTNNGLVDLRGFSNSIANLGGSGTVTNSGGSPVVLSVNLNGATTFNGLLTEGTSALALRVGGAGTLMLGNANNTYSGNTTVTSATLKNEPSLPRPTKCGTTLARRAARST